MYVERVLEFIKDLKVSGELTVYDAKLYSELEEWFHQRNKKDKLNNNDRTFLLECYNYRWKYVKDKEHDYTLNPEGINQIWIRFSKELAPIAIKHYYQILFPTVSNITDFNNKSNLTETESPDNFYLGQGGRTLYRKRGLCERLIENKFNLSTSRDIHGKTITTLTVDELTRLKACKQLKGQFSIADEPFQSFWDFLQKKVFNRLQDKGRLPLEIVPNLLGLIEQYYFLKQTKADFSQFKKLASEFFIFLSQSVIDNLNFLYGIRIPYKGSQTYLLDIFIDLKNSKDYDLDEQLNALAGWLYSFNSNLKVNTKELEAIYISVNQQRQSNKGSLVIPEVDQTTLLYPCLSLLLSLMTTKFDTLPISGVTIGLWDKTNTVFSEAEIIYKFFVSALTENRKNDLLSIYQKVIKEHVSPYNRDTNYFTWLTRFNSRAEWYQYVEQECLDKLDIYWVQPELLLFTLLQFRSGKSLEQIKIQSFLDKLIHTYAQNQNELLKEFRVNILFTKLLKGLDPQDKKQLLLLLKLYDVQEAKDNFLICCNSYISRRLNQISINNASGSVTFFKAIRNMDSSSKETSHAEFNKVSDIIEAYRIGLSSPIPNLDKRILTELFKYIRGISRPIFTVSEIETAENSARPNGFFS